MPSLTPNLVLSFTYNDINYIGIPQDLRDMGVPEATILVEAKHKVEHRISNYAKVKIENIVSQDYSPFEAARWTELVVEAESYLNNGITSDYLMACQSSGEDLTVYCNKILTDKAGYEYILATVRKTRYEKIEEMKLLTTPEDVLNFDHTSGWAI